MSPASLSRRQFHRWLSAVGASTLLPPASHATPARGRLDLDSPADALTAMVKMRGSLIAEDVPHWYAGTMYAVLPGRAPVPLVDFEGSEIDYYERQPDGSYHAYGATVSLFRDTITGKRLEAFDNPVTGKRNEVRPSSISVKAYYIYSVQGFKRSDDPRPIPADSSITTQLKWQTYGDHVWLTMRRAYPAGLPMGEHQLVRGTAAELHDPHVPKVYTTASPTFVSPWPDWLDMADQPGHTLWVGPALKLDSVTQYPRELLDFLEQNFAEKLTAKPQR